ncbi:MAG: ROK family protein [Candidatus Edwardsbacteria bacterium]
MKDLKRSSPFALCHLHSPFYLIGIDLGGTNIKAVLITPEGKIVKSLSVKTLAERGPDAVMQRLVMVIETLKKWAIQKNAEVKAVGIGAAGLIENGRVHTSPNLPGWKDVPLARFLQKFTHLKVVADNDVNAFVLAEVTYGAAKGKKNVIGVTIGTGVGGGIVLNGKLYHGPKGSAGEIGHTTINFNGPLCLCGNRGCLEAYVSAKYIVEATICKMQRKGKSILSQLVRGDLSKLTPKIISEAAKRGDPLSQEVIRETGRVLGIGLASVVNLLNPEIIVIGGGIAKAGKILFEAVKDSIRERAFQYPAEFVKIVPAKLGTRAASLGAACLIRDR